MSNHLIKDSYDVVILGSGFGASLLGLILSRQGKSVVIVDKSSHPRFAIGESSTPIADRILSELSEFYEIAELKPISRFGAWREHYPEHNCGCKRGFTYFWHGDGNEYQAHPDHQHELFVSANASKAVADTQWYRPQLDSFMFKTACDYGVTAYMSASVQEINHRHVNQWEVNVSTTSQEVRIVTRMMIDATGPDSLLLDSLGIGDRRNELMTHSHAIYSHWRNCTPVSEWCQKKSACCQDFPYDPDDSVVHHLFNDGWMWQIRFEDGLASLGFVSHRLPDEQKVSAESRWENILSHWPVVRDVIGSPELSEFPGRVFATDRLQRLRSQAAGPDWAALPFTVGFVDPLHSTGIAQTLSAVKRLVEIIVEYEESDRTIRLEQYNHDVIAELHHIDRLVYGCYLGMHDFRLFTTWAMVYFAAATHYENLMSSGHGQQAGFLCANEPGFDMLTRRLLSKLITCVEGKDQALALAWLQDVENELKPYNRVGLFHPAIPNMYTCTSASK